MKIGYIGLGALGNELARRFLPAHELWVWDLNPAAAARLSEVGAKVATSAADLARNADVLLTCLPRSSDVRQLLFGADGIAQALAPGTLLIDQTSGIPRETNETARLLADRGVTMLDAAVSASPHLVPQGLATLMVSGPDDVYERALPLLQAITPTIYRCGTRVGDGQAMKIVNNAMNAGARMGTLEIVALGRKAGLSLECMTDVLNKGGGGNLTTERMLPAIAQGKSATNFALALMLKDLNQAVALGMDMGVPMPLTSAVRSLLQIGLNTLGDSARLEEMIGVIESMAAARLAQPAEAGAAHSPTCDSPHGAQTLKVGYVGSGAIATFDFASLAKDCDVILLSLATPTAVREAVFGAHGMAKGLCAGKIIIDQCGGTPEQTRRLAADLLALGVALVDAPVLGDQQDPTARKIFILSAGSPEVCARVRPILERVGTEVVYCGQVGNAQVARLINNAVAVLCRHVTYESVAAGCKFGLRLQDMCKILHRCSGWSDASRQLLPLLVSGQPLAGQHIQQVVDDLQLVAELAMTHGAPTTILNAVRSQFEAGANRFGNDASIQEMTRLVEDVSGVKFTAA